MVGIVAFGGYVPRLRLQRQAVHAANSWFAPGLGGLAKGERAIGAWDEDTITMAVEAARDCLAQRDRGIVQRLSLASTTLPNADRQNSTVVKEALNLSDDVAAMDVSGSQRAGTSSLLEALYAVGGGAGNTLCIASEHLIARPASETELTSAHAAGAMLVGTDNLAARFLGGHSVTIDFVDHFRASDQQFDYGWEQRWVRDEAYGKIVPKTIAKALAKCGITAKDVKHFILASPLKGVNATVAKSCGFAPESVTDVLADKLGDAGPAQAFVLLSHVLERAAPKEKIVLVSFGGGCDVLCFETTDAVAQGRPATGVTGMLADRKPEACYTRYLAQVGLLDIDRGMRAELDQKPVLTALYRERKTVLGLVGGRCTQTGIVQFPKSIISVAHNARTVNTQEDYPLAERKARILSYTADNLTYSPDPPGYYGGIEFEGGGRLTTDFVDLDDGGVEVGMPVRMVFRIKAVDERRGFTKYFWKAVPDRRSTKASA